jgi:hypothetical protein
MMWHLDGIHNDGEAGMKVADVCTAGLIFAISWVRSGSGSM